MPAALTYPGVYVEEIPSGVRTITGVATSITAFIGRAERGPVNQAVTINSFGDFEREFGGLWASSSLGFAVSDFFLNGGSQAIIVRLFDAGADAAKGKPAPLTVGSLKFVAADPGQWGVYLRVSVDLPVPGSSTSAVAANLGVAVADLFNVTVVDTSTGKSERFLSVTVKNSARRVDNVLAAGSSLIAYDGVPDSTIVLAAGKDALSVPEAALAAAQQTLVTDQNAGASAATIATDKAAVTAAKTAADTAVTSHLANTTDGASLKVSDFLTATGQTDKTGLYALEHADLFNILCIPPYLDSADVDVNLVSAAAAYCNSVARC